MIVKQSFRRSK